MLWTLVWLMCLIGALISFVATAVTFVLALDRNSFTYLLIGVGFIFLTTFLGWASWAASFMS